MLCWQCQQWSQSWWSLGRQFSGHSIHNETFSLETEATKLFVSLRRLVGNGRVSGYFPHKYESWLMASDLDQGQMYLKSVKIAEFYILARSEHYEISPLDWT